MNEQRRLRATHLAEILDQNERSQSWLARKVGVSQALMSYIVNGERTMSEQVANAISDVFGVPLFLFAEFTDANDSVTVREVAA